MYTFSMPKKLPKQVIYVESLDDLAELVVEKFKDVPNTNIELDKYEDCAPMTEAQLKVNRVEVEKRKEEINICLQ